jgi:K+-transporting ATPase KdpF subunit
VNHDLLGYIVSGIIAAAVTIYLIAAMLLPEKF